MSATTKNNRLLAYVLLLAVTLYAMTLPSCGLVAPKPAVNGNAHPPAKGTVAGHLSNYVDNQHVAGIIDPTFVPSVNDTSVNEVTLTVDSKFVGAVTSPPYTFKFDTKGWFDGNHLFQFGVHEKGDTLGLLQLPGSPATIVYPITFDFDRTPPTAPQNVSVGYENEHFTVSWTPVNDANFAYYDIIKTYYDFENAKRQEEFKVYRKTPGTFIDTTQYISLPDSVEYQVGTSNNITTAYAPAPATSSVKSLGLGSASVLAQDVNGQVIFDVNNYDLKSASTTTGTASPATGSSGVPMASVNAALSPDRSELYVKDLRDYGIAVFDTKTLQKVSYIGSFYPYNVFAVGANNLVYFAYDSSLTVFNSATDTRLKTYSVFNTRAVSLKMSPAGNSLIAVDFSGIKRFAVSDGSVKLTAAYGWRTAAYWWTPNFISVDWNSSRICAALDGESTVRVLNAQTLAYIASISPPDPVTHVNTNMTPKVDSLAGICTNANNIYVAYIVENPDIFHGTLLAEYNKTTFKQQRLWMFTRNFKKSSSIGLSEKGRYLFLCDGPNQWIVDIGDSLQ